MWTLTRSVRLNVNSRGPAGISEQNSNIAPRTKGSGYSGLGSASGLPAHYQFDVLCSGLLDPLTSYVRDIKQIDRALEKALASLLDERLTSAGSLQDPVSILASAATSINRELGGGVRGVRWWVTPYHSYEMSPAAQSSPQDSVLVRQRFDFSASHRLHNPAMSEAENRARFGKCNNPAGHGHNYVIEPAVRVALGTGFDRAFTHADLQELCTSAIISRFDHTHLNVDTAEFSEKSGVLPTVENIARVFFEILAPRIAAHGGASLASMTVWETDRTSSTYPG